MTKRGKQEASQRFIEDNLKRVYQQTLNEEVPDRFKNLLEQLRAESSANTKEDEADKGGNTQ